MLFKRYIIFSRFINIFLLTYHSDNYSIYIMEPKEYFNNPNVPAQRHYEALRAFYYDGLL